MLYLKRRKNESWGAMLMLSIYVYLLWGWRQQELSNTFVKCLEDLRIKLKPAEVSCKSRCASLGARIVYLVLVTVKYSSWKTWERSVLSTSLGSGGSSLSRRLQQRFYPASGYCSSAGKSPRGHSQGMDVPVPPRPCLQHHGSREQAEPGHVSASALSSTRAVVPKRSKVRGLWRYTLMAHLDANSVGLHLIMKCKCWGLFVCFI